MAADMEFGFWVFVMEV